MLNLVFILIQDVYGFNLSDKRPLPHCMETIYVMWVMPNVSFALAFQYDNSSQRSVH